MELTSNVRISTTANLSAEFHEHLTRPGVQNDQEMSTCLLEPTNVVSFDENVSYSETLMNLYERNEHFSTNETRTNTDTII